MINHLISIIIPVFQVEKYLDKCIASVVAQTYQNLEIILVDDGSTDRCPVICDEWAARDSRIVVIHQYNQGLSEARNHGTDACSGSYILYIDSDDYIERNMVECLLQVCIDTDADVSCCGHYKEYANHVVNCPLTKERKIFEGEEIVISAMKGGVFSHYAWNKLWRRELFDSDCRFPPCMYFEDIATVWKLFLKCQKVVCIPDILYHYVARKDSIGNTKSMKNLVDRWVAFKERYDVMATRSEELRQICAKGCLDTIGYTWRWLHAIDKKDRDEEKLQEMKIFLKENSNNIKLCSGMTRLSLFCTLYSNFITVWGCFYSNQIYRRIHGMDQMM